VKWVGSVLWTTPIRPAAAADFVGMKRLIPGTIVRTHAELAGLWETMMGRGGFGVASVWLMFLDAGNRVLPVVVPIDGIPAEPDPGFVSGLARIVSGLVESGDTASVAVLLSRPGEPAMTEADRRWARALRSGLGDEVGVWPVHLATRGQVRVFAPDDLVAAS
jgi:hypothetical protein